MSDSKEKKKSLKIKLSPAKFKEWRRKRNLRRKRRREARKRMFGYKVEAPKTILNFYAEKERR